MSAKLDAAEQATRRIRVRILKAKDVLTRDTHSNAYGVLMYPDQCRAAIGEAIENLTVALRLATDACWLTDAEYDAEGN